MEELRKSASVINKVVVVSVALIAAVVLFADDLPTKKSSSPIPTAEAIKAAMPKIEELTRDDFAALKAKKKTSAETADTLLGYIGADDEPVAKFLFRRMAFRQYVLGAAFDKADELYSAARSENGIEYALGIVGNSRQKLVGNAAKALKDRIFVDEKAVKDITAIKAQIAKAPKDDQLQEQLAFAYVAFGDWDAALLAFSGCSGEVAKVAAWELKEDGNRDGNYDAAKVAGFWWAIAEKQARRRAISESVKVHAVNWYKKALALNLLSGLDKKVADRRIEECAALAERTKVVEPKGKGLYMIVDLTKIGKQAITYLDEAPKDGWSDEFRTKKIVLRKIAPGSFEYLPGKSFKITKPFYIGVFEVTQKQYEMTTKASPSGHKGDMRPAENVSYIDIRGPEKGLGWPKDDCVDKDSYLGKMRQKFAIAFDLPTEVHWEYACRAGTKGDFNVEGVEMVKLGKCADNGGETDKHVKVGSFRPNAWGLYDMHGNVWEWCVDRGPNGGGWMDWSAEAKEAETDPKGPAGGSSRILRGGSWDYNVPDCRASRRLRYDPRRRWDNLGFRLACPAETVK